MEGIETSLALLKKTLKENRFEVGGIVLHELSC